MCSQWLNLSQTDIRQIFVTKKERKFAAGRTHAVFLFPVFQISLYYIFDSVLLLLLLNLFSTYTTRRINLLILSFFFFFSPFKSSNWSQSKRHNQTSNLVSFHHPSCTTYTAVVKQLGIQCTTILTLGILAIEYRSNKQQYYAGFKAYLTHGNSSILRC